jgi:hypothetical protein
LKGQKDDLKWEWLAIPLSDNFLIWHTAQGVSGDDSPRGV